MKFEVVLACGHKDEVFSDIYTSKEQFEHLIPYIRCEYCGEFKKRKEKK